MPRLTNAVPKYSKHRASGQAVVTIAGRDCYLGPHGTKASRLEYDRLITEWLAAGRPSTIVASTAPDLTINEVLIRYWKFVELHYRKDGKPTSEQDEIRQSLRVLKEWYGKSPVSEFGPLALKPNNREPIMKFAVLLMSVTLFASPSFSQELLKEQAEPWSTLKRQVSLYFERDWEEHDKYIHPKIVDWGDATPSPIHFGDDAAKRYWEKVEDGADKVIAHYLVPVSVVVVGDVAIINAHLHMLTKPEGKPVEKIFRLHNTWKKEDGRWLLLATYNTTVTKPESDD